MNTSENTSETRTAAATGLAVVGFVALVAAGIWLAVYSTRYVPSVVNNAGAAAIYLGSVFTRSTASLSVVPAPTASSTISSTVASSTTPTSVEPTSAKPGATTPGPKTGNTYLIGSTGSSPALTGLPDFIVVIKDVGYLATTSADSFVATSTVPSGGRPAVSFTIKNVGTNSTGAWCFSASIPTQTAYIYQSQPQQSLNPGDSIDYTLGFDQANKGSGQTVSISANIGNSFNTATCARAVTESTSDNNSASAKITILGN